MIKSNFELMAYVNNGYLSKLSQIRLSVDWPPAVGGIGVSILNQDPFFKMASHITIIKCRLFSRYRPYCIHPEPEPAYETRGY